MTCFYAFRELWQQSKNERAVARAATYERLVAQLANQSLLVQTLWEDQPQKLRELHFWLGGPLRPITQHIDEE